MKSQVLYLMLFLANMVYGFTSVNNLNTLNKFVPNNRNKLVSIKMVDKDLDIQKNLKHQDVTCYYMEQLCHFLLLT